MEFVEKTLEIKKLKREISKIQKQLKSDVFEYVMEGFRRYGFVEDPRGGSHTRRGLYNPELGVSVWVGDITVKNVLIQVRKMVDNGLNYDMETTQKLIGYRPSSDIRWTFDEIDFDVYMEKKFKKRVELLTQMGK
jgi:hypothetical protein